MIKFLLHLLFLSLLCVGLSRCRHEPEGTPTPCDCGEVNSIDELREWAFFKEGTYWIYEEETTHARDTFTVVDSNDFITDQGNVQFDYETYRSSDGYYYWFWFIEGWTSTCAQQGCCSCRTLWCDKYKSGEADGESRLFRFPNFVGNYSYLTAGLEVGYLEVIEVLDSFCFLDTCFQNVVVSENSLSVLDQSTLSDNYYSVIYFFSKSIGIVRKEILQTAEVWNLMEYHIQQ